MSQGALCPFVGELRGTQADRCVSAPRAPRAQTNTRQRCSESPPETPSQPLSRCTSQPPELSPRSAPSRNPFQGTRGSQGVRAFLARPGRVGSEHLQVSVRGRAVFSCRICVLAEPSCQEGEAENQTATSSCLNSYPLRNIKWSLADCHLPGWHSMSCWQAPLLGAFQEGFDSRLNLPGTSPCFFSDLACVC